MKELSLEMVLLFTLVSYLIKNKIGINCSIGQNVYVANNVRIGNNCKIQNNVSLYEGVILEDYVFCVFKCCIYKYYNQEAK